MPCWQSPVPAGDGWAASSLCGASSAGSQRVTGAFAQGEGQRGSRAASPPGTRVPLTTKAEQLRQLEVC